MSKYYTYMWYNTYNWYDSMTPCAGCPVRIDGKSGKDCKILCSGWVARYKAILTITHNIRWINRKV